MNSKDHQHAPVDSSTVAALAICHDCDWVMTVPPLQTGESACCPRCGHTADSRSKLHHHHPIAWASAALIMLMAAVSFPFVSFEVQGVTHTIVVSDTAQTLFSYEFPFLGLLVLATTILLPTLYLLAAIHLHVALALNRRPIAARLSVHLLTGVKPWVMSDVFVVGVLVSMIKVLSLANVQLGLAFYAFCGYAVLLLTTVSTIEPHGLWASVAGVPDMPAGLTPGAAAASQGAAGCSRCKAIVSIAGLTGQTHCPRCGQRNVVADPRRLQATWALIITAAILYIPAMTYPVMIITEFGRASPQTIVSGAWHLLETGSWPIALVIFVASVVVPVGKMFSLGWLCIQAQSGVTHGAYDRLRLYRITEAVGRWSMIDVFVVALLVALIQAGELMHIQPGPGAGAFASVVILTMLAAMVFDPRLIWRFHEDAALHHE